MKIIKRQLSEANISSKHDISYYKGEEVLAGLEDLDFQVQTMGRGYNEDKEYFMTAGVAALLASEELERSN